MAEVVAVDKSGRIVIPKNLRQELNIGEKTKFILTKGDQGRLLLQKLEAEEIAQRLERELSGKDIDAIVDRAKKEIHKKVKASYEDLLT